MPKTSSTKRLVALMRRFSEQGQRLGAHASVGEALAAILQQAPQDPADLQVAYTRMLRLVDASRDEVAEHYHDPDLSTDDSRHLVSQALRPLDDVRNAVVNNSIHSPVTVVTQFPLRELELLAITITKDSSEQDLTDDDVTRSKAALDEALAVILDSSLSARYKAAFSALINQARLSLDHYAIFGADGVTEAIGLLFARSVGLRATASTVDTATIGAALSRVSTVLTIIYRGIQIATALLSSGSHVPPPSDPSLGGYEG
jgi:hypothetical protein